MLIDPLAVQLMAAQTQELKPTFNNCDIHSRLDATDLSTIIFELLAELESLLNIENLLKAIVDLLAEGEVLYESV